MSTPSPEPERTPSPPPDHPEGDSCPCHPDPFAARKNKLVSQFFNEHFPLPYLRPRPSEFLSIEFGRLAKRKMWKNKERDRKWIECLISEFKLHLDDCLNNPVVVQDEDGKADRVIKGRHAELIRLCMKFDLEVGEYHYDSIEACAWLLNLRHVNLLDWLECMRRGNKPYYFESKRKLQDHNMFQDRLLPRQVVDAIPSLMPLAKRTEHLLAIIENEKMGLDAAKPWPVSDQVGRSVRYN